MIPIPETIHYIFVSSWKDRYLQSPKTRFYIAHPINTNRLIQSHSRIKKQLFKLNSCLLFHVGGIGQISNRFLLFIYPIISSLMLRGRGGTPESKAIISVIRKLPKAIGGANTGGVITRPIAAFYHSLSSIAWTLGILRWGVAKVIIFKPVCYPLKHIAGHIHHTVRTCVIWIASHGSCI